MTTQRIEVFVGDTPAGILTVDQVPGTRREHISFTYHEQWLATGFPLSPELPLDRVTRQPTLGRNIFGAFADAGPDRWGGRLIQEQARRAGIPAFELTETRMLLLVPDDTRQGALRFRTNGKFQGNNSGAANIQDLDTLAKTAQQIADGSNLNTATNYFLQTGTSPGGAQPKTVVRDNNGQLWLAKYPLSATPLDQGRWEHATALASHDAGIDVPETRILPIDSSSAIFLTRRFDRTINGERLPYVSFRTMLQFIDEPVNPSYVTLARELRHWSSTPERDLDQWFRRAVFNAAISNNDDHLRNFGLLRGPDGWHLSPAFDVNPAPATVRSNTPLTPHGDPNKRDPQQLLDYAADFGITPDHANQILHEVTAIARQLPEYGLLVGVAPEALDTPMWRTFRENTRHLPTTTDRQPNRSPQPGTGTIWVRPHLRNGKPVAGHYRTKR